MLFRSHVLSNGHASTYIFLATNFAFALRLGTSFQEGEGSKAIPIKCLVSHRTTDPFFWKSKKKKKIPESLVKKQVL